MNRDDFNLGLKQVRVKYSGRYVGTLALSANGRAAFSYDDEWLRSGFSISPFSLPLEKKVFIPKSSVTDGLFGIFADSLPDAWGRLLVDRMIKKADPQGEVTVLERLALVGKSGMGALEYVPDILEQSDLTEAGKRRFIWQLPQHFWKRILKVRVLITMLL